MGGVVGRALVAAGEQLASQLPKVVTEVVARADGKTILNIAKVAALCGIAFLVKTLGENGDGGGAAS